MSTDATAAPPLPPPDEPLRPAGLLHDAVPANGPIPSNASGLRSAEFRHGRELGWRRLEDMIDRVEKRGIGELSADEVRELPLLYRAAVSSLSVARSIVLDRNLLLYLENLSLRAYLTVYGPRVSITQSLGEFFRRDFPRSVRGMGRHFFLALAALIAGTVAGWLLVRGDMSWFNTLVPESLAGSRGPGSSREDLLNEELFAPWPGFTETFVVFANFLFRHNTMVGIFSFGLGFALGIPTLMLMAYQGLVLGAFLALHADRGLLIDFVGWLSIHGATEIPAILLCGAAGLVVAEKILFPGPLPRLESLARHGKKAAGVVAGAVALFFIAGIVEGGFRQLIAHTPTRFAFACVSGALWLFYFLRVGREDHERAD